MSWFSKAKEPTPQKEDELYSSLGAAPPSFSPLVPPPPAPPSLAGKSSKASGTFSGFTAPPVSLDYKPAKATSKDDDPYMREVERSYSSVPDLAPSKPSVFDQIVSGDWIQNPRARQCFSNIQMGMKMGGIVGGIFGGLAGTVYAIRERRFLVLPATTIVCAGSFAFFLGCGMIIRCEEAKR